MESDMSISAPSDGLSDGVLRIQPLHGRTSGPARRSTKGQWTPEEDEILRKAVQRFKGKSWKKIAECFKDRTDVQCLHRWQKVLNPELVKGPWSKEEDEMIIELVNKYGAKKWSTIAQHLPGRIGKQCRERWHNHLNPTINKEAWTQEEELALIRAHQIYGNRWAELSKFLPGRSDNAIKNHWNSSVKKKLDSYLASGLLEQFQDLPPVVHKNQPMPSSSSRIQSSGDDNDRKCGTEGEEISECSQESTVVSYSQPAGDFCNAVLHTREEFQYNEESILGKDQTSSPASCSEHYYASLSDVKFSIPEIPCEVGFSSNFIRENFSHDTLTKASKDCQFNLHELHNMSSLELGHEPLGLPPHSVADNQSHELLIVPFQTSMGLSAPTTMGNNPATKLDQILISDDECCRILFSDAMTFTSENLMKPQSVVDLGGSADPLLHQSNIKTSEIDTPSASQSYYPSGSGELGTSCSHLFLSAPSLPSADDNAFTYDGQSNQLIAHSLGNCEQEFITSVHDGFICTKDAASLPSENVTDNTDQQEQSFFSEPSKLVPVNTFISGSVTTQSCPPDENQIVNTEQQDAGALCYEPPRFPSLDIPFLSCDLIQSGSDMQQEYSPLGIRQLMMSSMSCMTPFRLWDSPSRDGSPDAVLKSAAKTFTGTPSILKKRNRDLLSPLSERRSDKKLEIDVTSSLSKEFSRLDVMFDESETEKPTLLSPSSNQRRNFGSPSGDKENLDPAFKGGQERGRNCSVSTDNKILERDFESSKQETDNNDAEIKVQKPSGAIAEDNMNNLPLFSPDQVGFKAERALCPSAQTPRNLYRRILGTLSEQSVGSESSSGNPCLAVSSPSICRKSHGSPMAATASVQYIPLSAPLEKTVDNAGNDGGTENFGIFGGTPFKRSIESPSAWKSPWFINSFLPGPRIDTEISVEDIGLFMSPGDRSYDAIALMKQLSEHTASAYSEALEVLGNETPQTIMKRKHSNDQNVNQENDHAPSNQIEHSSHSASNVMIERRILDFSECGTPVKVNESGKSSTAMTFSSPSSYLLKGCR